MPALRGESATARASLQQIAPYLASLGATIDLVRRESAGRRQRLVWTQDVTMADGSFTLRYSLEPSRLSSMTWRLVPMHIVAGCAVLTLLLLLVGSIVNKSILAPLAAGKHQLAHMKRGGGWLPALPAVDAELDPLYSAIRELGPALEHQVDEWLETDRRSQTALIFLQLKRRLHAPLRQAIAAASLLQKAAGLPPSLSVAASNLQEHLGNIESIVSSEEDKALSSLGRRDGGATDARRANFTDSASAITTTNSNKEVFMLRLKVWSLTLALAFAISFVLCVLWGFVVPARYHMVSLLEATLPGFQWLTVSSFFLGLIESALWGFYVALVVVPLHNFFARRAA